MMLLLFYIVCKIHSLFLKLVKKLSITYYFTVEGYFQNRVLIVYLQPRLIQLILLNSFLAIPQKR